MILEALVRRIQRLSGNQQPSLDEFGSTLISQMLPKYTRLAAAGKLFVADMSGGTAIAPVVAMPVASPSWGLYNASLTECQVPLLVIASLEGGTAGLGLSVVMGTALGPQTLVTGSYAGTIISASDGSQRKPDAHLTSNPTLVGGTPAWQAMEGTKVNTLATDSVGDTIVAKPEGMFIARPGGGMVGIEFVGETGSTALFDIQILFAQIELDLY